MAYSKFEFQQIQNHRLKDDLKRHLLIRMDRICLFRGSFTKEEQRQWSKGFQCYVAPLHTLDLSIAHTRVGQHLIILIKRDDVSETQYTVLETIQKHGTSGAYFWILDTGATVDKIRQTDIHPRLVIWKLTDELTEQFRKRRYRVLMSPSSSTFFGFG